MYSVLIVILAVIGGAIWIYDGVTARPKRKQSQQEEPTYVAYARGICLIALFLICVSIFNIGILTMLVMLTAASAIVWLIDRRFFKAKREKAKQKEPLLVDYARSLFPIFLIVLIIRAFIAQPFRVPTGSLEPTVMPGDLLIVSQFSYGLRLPITHTKILALGEPKRGDIGVFRYPVNPKIDYIKRIVGLPGDHIVYKNKVFYINDKEMKQTFVRDSLDYEPASLGGNIPTKVMNENLDGINHLINIRPTGGATTDFDFTIPKGYYLAIGDNRDNSLDSRYWGLVPEKNFIGKAEFIFMSWDSEDHKVRWDRIGDKL